MLSWIIDSPFTTVEVVLNKVLLRYDSYCGDSMVMLPLMATTTSVCSWT